MRTHMLALVLITWVLIGCNGRRLADYNLTETEVKELIELKRQLALLDSDSTKGLFTVNEFKSTKIDSVRAENLTRWYNNKLRPAGTGDRNLYSLLHGPSNDDTRVSYRILADDVRSIIKEPGEVDWLLIFPATESDPGTPFLDFTFVLAGGKNKKLSDGKDEIEVLKAGAIYNEVGACPPPNGCRGFNQP